MKIRLVKCGDIGIANCNYMAIGNSLDDVENNMLEHIGKEHADLLASMTDDEIHQLKHRVSTFLGRSCGCGHLPKP